MKGAITVRTNNMNSGKREAVGVEVVRRWFYMYLKRFYNKKQLLTHSLFFLVANRFFRKSQITPLRAILVRFERSTVQQSAEKLVPTVNDTA